jgi:hypothetical protein
MPEYFAHRPGDPPSPSASVVAGVGLPVGSLRTGESGATFWVSEEYLERPAALAGELVVQFSQTGLWPLGWSWESESPEAYSTEEVDLDVVEAIDVGQVLRSAWEDYGFDPNQFLGLAEPSNQRSTTDAFSILDGAEPWSERPGRRLLLVPCTRPADALAVLGFLGERLEPAPQCAVLRSWEERFGAFLVDLSPSSVTFAVHAPPATPEQARRLAAEIAAVATTDELTEVDGIESLAATLQRAQHWQMTFEN